MPSAPPEPPSPITTQMIGRGQPRHLEHRVGDDLGLAAFLGADARIGPGVSIRQITGMWNLAASFILAIALR